MRRQTSKNFPSFHALQFKLWTLLPIVVVLAVQASVANGNIDYTMMNVDGFTRLCRAAKLITLSCPNAVVLLLSKSFVSRLFYYYSVPTAKYENGKPYRTSFDVYYRLKLQTDQMVYKIKLPTSPVSFFTILGCSCGEVEQEIHNLVRNMRLAQL